jgi:hypothetical protein
MRAAEMQRFVSPDPQASFLFLYRGGRCSQTPRVLEALDELDSSLAPGPTTVIEVGTFAGGFTHVLSDHDITRGAELHTFDVTDWGGNRGKATFHSCDVPNDKALVAVLVARPGRCVLFCDGGDKEREVRELCPLLKRGDLILAHDYVREVGDHLRYGWPGYETVRANVQAALDENGFIPHVEETMASAMWGCWMKR